MGATTFELLVVLFCFALVLIAGAAWVSIKK